MRKIFTLLMMILISSALAAQSKKDARPVSDTTLRVVEASCGQCKLGLKGKGCDLAVRIDGKAYYVDGTGINDHGDAHDDDGFCNAIRQAEVKGSVVNNRFVVTYFKLLPVKKD